MKALKDDSQNTLVLGYLARGKKLTPLSALSLFGCLRLGGRIFELRSRGHKIRKTMVTTRKGKRIAEYFMAAV